MDSGRHKLSENIWFVWSKMSYSGDMEGCHACARTTDGQRTECEDRARILETEFAISDWRYIEKGVGECKMGVSFCRGDKRKLCGFCTKETPEKYW